DLDADEVAIGVLACREAQGFAIAESGFKHAPGVAAEGGVEVALPARVVQSVTWPQFVECTLLRRGEAALTQHEATHLAMPRFGCERLRRSLGTFAGERISHRRKMQFRPQPASRLGGAWRQCASTDEAVDWRRRIRMAPARDAPGQERIPT